MDHRNAQVGWTEAQWNRVREEVLQAWQRVRVAGSFLPIYGPLPPSTTVVPSEVLKDDGSVDDRATADLVEIALPVVLSRQQVLEEDLSSALLQFRRRATQLGQLEDWFIFNGTYPSIELSPQAAAEFAQEKRDGFPHYRPDLPYLDQLTPKGWAPISGTPRPIDEKNQRLQKDGMRRRNPGPLGLIEGPRMELDDNYKQALEERGQAEQAELEEQALQPPQAQAQPQGQALERAQQKVRETMEARDEISGLDSDGLTQAVIAAINSLEANGYAAPYVCVFGRNPFQAAYRPINNSTVLPRDRIEPLIGREILHASGIDLHPHKRDRYDLHLGEGNWQSRGVLLSLADEPIDLALAAEATPEFRHVDLDGNFVFSVFERFALRIKDTNAIVPLKFVRPWGTAAAANS